MDSSVDSFTDEYNIAMTPLPSKGHGTWTHEASGDSLDQNHNRSFVSLHGRLLKSLPKRLSDSGVGRMAAVSYAEGLCRRVITNLLIKPKFTPLWLRKDGLSTVFSGPNEYERICTPNIFL